MIHSSKSRFEKITLAAKDELHRHPLIKFIIVFVLLVGYVTLTSLKFGVRDGLMVSVLTWSFFVLCTPIADAGFLLDLPLRILTGIRMLYSEILVWIIAIALNVLVFFTNVQIYEDTVILSLFHHILAQPWPFWGIIILSGIGTFLSVVFGDEIIDVSLEKKSSRKHHRKHRRKHHFILILFLIVLILILYDYLLNSFGISIPWF